MLDALFTAVKSWPPELATFFLAMLPVTELRASIPFAIGFFDMLPFWAFFWSVLGDLIPAIFIVWFMGPLADWLSAHSKIFKKLFDWWFKKIIKDFELKFQKYGPLALLLFVAIPLPITGSWTGSVASFLFNVPRKKALLYISGGVLIAGLLVTLISTGAFALAAR